MNFDNLIYGDKNMLFLLKHHGLPQNAKEAEEYARSPVKTFKKIQEQYLTKDVNLMNFSYSIQYNIVNPIDYLFKVQNIYKAISDITEYAFTEVIGSYPAVTIETIKRSILEKQVVDTINQSIKRLDLGIKVNNLVDEAIINELTKAAADGVKISLLVRGVCSLEPSDGIEVRSIVGRYLEHSRVFWFGGEEGALYLGSADLMTRNLDIRIEVLTPIYDSTIRQELLDYLKLQWSDNQGARVINSELKNKKHTNGLKPIDSQLEIYNLLNN